MAVMVVYVIAVIIGETGAVELGFILDKIAPTFSLPIALALFFGVLALMWPISVKITERWLVRAKS